MRLATIAILFAVFSPQISGADPGTNTPKTIHYGKWHVVLFELSRDMWMSIGSTASNDAHKSITMHMKKNCTLGPMTLNWNAGSALDAESYGVLSVRAFGVQIADQPEEFYTGTDGRSPDTDDRFFTFGGLSPQRFYGAQPHGRLALWLRARGDGLVAGPRIYFSLDGFDLAYDHATKLCKESPYSES